MILPKEKQKLESSFETLQNPKEEEKKETPISGSRLLCTNIASIIIETLDRFGAYTLDDVKSKWSIILPQEFRNAIVSDVMSKVGNIIRSKYIIEYIPPLSEKNSEIIKSSIKIHTKKIRDSINHDKKESKTEATKSNFGEHFISFIIDEPLPEESNK